MMLRNTGEEDYFQTTDCRSHDKRSVNPDFRKHFQLLQPSTNILRFPGGEIANFYHLGNLDPSGCFTDTRGYGIKDKEILSRKNPNAFAKEKKDYTRSNRNVIFDLIELCKENPGLEIVYVVNLVTHFINHRDSQRVLWLDYYTSFNEWEDMLADPDFTWKMQENLNTIRLLQQHGIKIRAIELGNELYMNDYPATLSRADTPEEKDKYLYKYANLAKLYSDSLRKHFPGIPLGVPYSERNTQFERSWNRNLKTIDSYFDAYVLHDYYTGRESHSRHTHCNEKLEERILSLINFMDGQQKKIWITEWNLLFGQPVFSPNRNMNNAENAAYIFDYTTSIQRLNAQYDNIVEIITMHNLAAKSGAAPLFNASGNYFKHMTPSIEPNASVWGAYILSLFEQLLSTGEKWAIFDQVSINAVDSFHHNIDRNKLFLKPFWQPDADINGIFYFANMTDQSYLISGDNSYILTHDGEQSFAVGGAEMRSSPTFTIFYIDSISSGNFDEALLRSDTTLLPARSIGIILTQHLSGSDGEAQRRTPCSLGPKDITLGDLMNRNIRELLCSPPPQESQHLALRKSTEEARVPKVYPNPTRNNIWIEHHYEETGNLYIYNQMGMQLYQAPFNKGRHQINVSGWVSGVYHYVVRYEKEQHTGHFVVLR